MFTAKPQSASRAHPKSIVDVMVDILDEDGPAPMKGFRPAQKTPNGVDRFHEVHHDPYEERGKQSGDRIEEVHNHNRYDPKMRHELGKRRSTAHPTPTSLADEQQNNVPPHRHTTRCPICGRFKKKAEVRIARLKPQRNTESRITKRSANFRYRPVTRALSNISKVCIDNKHLYSYVVPSGVSAVIRSKSNSKMAKARSAMMFKSKEGGNETQASRTSVVMSGSKTDVDSGHPDTSEPSLSTYNSDMSIEHEPMVSSPE